MKRKNQSKEKEHSHLRQSQGRPSDSSTKLTLQDRLRRRAEELLVEKSENEEPGKTPLQPPHSHLDGPSKTDVESLIHELQVHQLELEIQNEELRRAQIELEESRNKYVDLYDFAPVGYFTLNENGLITEVNLTGAVLLGVERRNLIKRAFSRYIAKEGYSVFYSYREQLLDTTTSQTCELRMLRKDGTLFYAQLEGIAVFGTEGNLNRLRIAMLDITQRKRAEESLQEAHNELEIRVKQRTAELAKANEASQAELAERKRAEETLKKNLARLSKKNRYETIISVVTRSVHQSISLQDVLENAVEAANKNIEGVEYVSIYFVEGADAVIKAYRGYPDWFIERVGRIPYPKGFTWKTIIDGKPIYCADADKDTSIGSAGREVGTKSYLSMPIRFKDKVVGCINIHSLRKNAFDKEELKLLGIVAQQIETAIKNARQAEALRESEERFRNMADTAPVMIWVSGPDKLCTYFNKGWLEFTGRTMEEELDNGWTEAVHSDDLPRFLDTRVTAFGARQEFEMEYRLRRFNGEYRWVLDHGTPRFLPDDSFAGYIGSAIDITGHKQMEETLIRQAKELVRSNAELEQFAYLASHDLQEPLRKVANFTELLSQLYEGQLDSKAHGFIEYILDGTTRMQMLIKDLLKYSRVEREVISLEPTNIETVVSQILAHLETVIHERGGRVSYDPLPTVMVNPSQMGQLFQNLIGNAIKFQSEEPPSVHISAEQKNGEWVFSVRDNGIGIEPEFAERIFKVFQRLHTRLEYPGTGIGLAICKKIVELHGGRIWVESEPGAGATFYFAIPESRGKQL